MNPVLPQHIERNSFLTQNILELFFKVLNIQVRRGALSRAANMVVAIVAMAVGVSLLVSASNIFIRIIALREIHFYL